MTKSIKTSGFWAEGHVRQLEALKDQEQAEREELEKQRRLAPSPAQRAELTAMIRRVLEKYRRLRQAADQSLYVAGTGAPATRTTEAPRESGGTAELERDRPPTTRLFESTDNKLGDESELFKDLED